MATTAFRMWATISRRTVTVSPTGNAAGPSEEVSSDDDTSELGRVAAGVASSFGYSPSEWDGSCSGGRPSRCSVAPSPSGMAGVIVPVFRSRFETEW